MDCPARRDRHGAARAAPRDDLRCCCGAGAPRQHAAAERLPHIAKEDRPPSGRPLHRSDHAGNV